VEGGKILILKEWLVVTVSLKCLVGTGSAERWKVTFQNIFATSSFINIF
jgi:hypothetical protein